MPIRRLIDGLSRDARRKLARLIGLLAASKCRRPWLWLPSDKNVGERITPRVRERRIVDRYISDGRIEPRRCVRLLASDKNNRPSIGLVAALLNFCSRPAGRMLERRIILGNRRNAWGEPTRLISLSATSKDMRPYIRLPRLRNAREPRRRNPERRVVSSHAEDGSGQLPLHVRLRAANRRV